MSRRLTSRRAPSSMLLLLALLTLMPAAAAAEIVDRIVATVGKRVITLSEIQEEHRYESMVNHAPLQPPDAPRIREVALRLIDQLLLEQEMIAAAAGRAPHVLRAEVELRLNELKKSFGNNGDFRSALQRYGLDEARVLVRLELETNILRFIDARFRPAVQVDQPEVELYYREKLLPELRAGGAREIPSLAHVREQIEEILVQQRINEKSAVWLKDLRGQAAIRFR